MQAIPHSTGITPDSPTADILADPLDTIAPNRTARRRAEVERALAEILAAAEAAGWTVTNDRTFSNGTSRYLDMDLARGVSVTVRVSDHAPSRAIGVAGDRPFVLAIVGVPGGIQHPIAWLVRMADQVGRVKRGQTHKVRLRRAVA